MIFLRFACHVLHIENLHHILGEDEWFVFISNLFYVHYCHPIPVYRYAATCSVHPLASKQRNLQGAIVKLPYFLYLVRALFILGSCVKRISIDLVPLVLHDCGRWSPSKPLQLYINRTVTYEFSSQQNCKAINVMTCNPGLRLSHVFRSENIDVLIHIWRHEG